MASLESILNVVIPIAVIIVFLGLIYMKLKDGIDPLLRWFGRIFSSMFEGIGDALSNKTATEVVYK